MPEKLSPQQRSALMSRVKQRDTAPELVVRRLLHRMGYRFRLHRKDLPGKPDIVLPRHRKIILVHGCLWHGHEGCRRGARPVRNAEFWNAKIDRNIARDTKVQAELQALGWGVLTVWQCETRDLSTLEAQLRNFLKAYIES
ncbi:MAG: very short patch repair endonuclease [Chloroflexota bacterium]|nr:very short patch repair endonuclease [Chloroflexota bacterium]